MRLLDVDHFVDVASDIVGANVDLGQRNLSLVKRHSGLRISGLKIGGLWRLPSAPFAVSGRTAC